MLRMRAPTMFHTAVQTDKTSPIKHENKRNVSSCMIESLMAFKFINLYQTRWPNGRRLVTIQCLTVFGHQTFPVCTGFMDTQLHIDSRNVNQGISVNQPTSVQIS